ncbi:hypothetical protein BH10PLA1_BH10PLA1_00330 [soil metagenome]
MRRPSVDDHVRLMQDVPDLELHRGQIGVVCSTWFAPSLAYEVEFESPELAGQIRAILEETQVQLDDDSALLNSVQSI